MSLHAFLMKHGFLWLVAFPCWVILIGLGAEYLGQRRSKMLRNQVSSVVYRVWSWLISYNGQVWPKAVSGMGNLVGSVDRFGTGRESAGRRILHPSSGV